MKLTIKLEGITSFSQLSKEKAIAVINAGERVITKHNKIILNSARAKIHIRTGAMSQLLKEKIDGKGNSFVVGHIGTIGASAEDAKAFNAYEYGHAKPGDSGGVKVVPGANVLRSSIDEDARSFKNDMQSEIKKVIET